MPRAFGIEVPWRSARAAKVCGVAVLSSYEIACVLTQVNVRTRRGPEDPVVLQVPLSVLGVDTGSDLS
jgi:hypothetical protein